MKIIFFFLSVILISPIPIFADEIPPWIKNTAAWWANGEIDEKAFLKTIEYLVDKNIIILDYDPIYENKSERYEIAKIQLYPSLIEAVDNPIFADKKIRIDLEGRITACGFPRNCLTVDPDVVNITVIYPNNETLILTPISISFDGNYNTSGIKLNPNSPKGVYEVKTEVDGKLVKQEYFLIEEKNNSGVPSWVKNNARWWSEGRINDSDFLIGIKHLVKEKIIKFERQTGNSELVNARTSISTGDLKPILYSITGEKLEAFFDLKKGNTLNLLPLETDPTFQPVSIERKALQDEKFPVKLPFGTYRLTLNEYTETFAVGTFGHTSTVLKTVTDDNRVYCLGTFMSYSECMGFKNTKHQDYSISLAHKPEWYEKQFQHSFDYDNYIDSYITYDYDIDYDADVNYFLNRAEIYAQHWLNEIEPYAQDYVTGEISWNEYERVGFNSFDKYSEQYINDFDNYFASKYGHYP